ncbi:MAG: hypothetical protein JXB38_12215 [Anaerolineales bacterium]|nr:hypothetical protein [Anaerolineales bacterium]
MSQQKSILLLVVLSLVLAGCQTARAATPEPQPRNPDGSVSVALGEPFRLALDESADYAGALRIAFVEMLGDSRCPSDADCIIAGQVQVKVAVSAAGQPQVEVILTLGDLYPGNVQQVELHGCRLSLQAVEPYPVTTRRTQPDEYRVTLILEQVGEE